MDIQILSDSMFGVIDDNGVQVGQEAIPENLKSLPDFKLRQALRELKQMPPVEIAAPLPPTEVPVQVAYHEHPEHTHEHSHEIQPHIHLMGDDVKERFEEDERIAKINAANILQVTGELRGDILTHEHPGYAAARHGHEDLLAAVDQVDRRVAVQERHVHEDSPPHAHAELALLRSDIDDIKATLGQFSKLLAEFENRITLLELKPAPVLEHTHDEFATQEGLDAHLREVQNRPVYYTAELSSQEVNGQKRFIVQEAPR